MVPGFGVSGREAKDEESRVLLCESGKTTPAFSPRHCATIG